MEEEKKQKLKEKEKHKSIHDILPLELIQQILLRVPVRHLARLRSVSKLWQSLISDPQFAELHFHHSPAPTNTFILITNDIAYLVYLDALFSDDYGASHVKSLSPLFNIEKKEHSHFDALASCRGFVLLNQYPHFVVWNPVTGSSKRIFYSHVVPRPKRYGFVYPVEAILYGFGYDASQDDYLVVICWCNLERQKHLDCFSLRTNSWINLDSALPKPLGFSHHFNRFGLFLNGAIHWLCSSPEACNGDILIFDMKERTFSMISRPEQLVMRPSWYLNLAQLGGCLALYYSYNGTCNAVVWIMKEYKVQSSWTLYQIPCKVFWSLCLSSNGDIIGRDKPLCDKIDFCMYNVRRDMLKHFKNFRFPYPIPFHMSDTVYTESLLSLPNDIKDKKQEEGKWPSSSP